MPDADSDRQVRVAAFQWLGRIKSIHGDVLPRSLLEQGFGFQGTRVPIVGPQGIFKPAATLYPLSITTIPGSVYDDDLRDGDSVIHYRYRGTNPNHHENVGLREAMLKQVPLVYCYRVMPSLYTVSFPVFVVSDSPAHLTFKVQQDDDIALNRFVTSGAISDDGDPTLRRSYVTVSSKRRLHQAAFRERVLRAYETKCALCRLRHGALLDAAHIIPDGEPDGAPIVSNGLSLCKIHHAAFDLNFLGIDADLRISVRSELLGEVDGPMLQHGLKAMHGEKIIVPKRASERPDRELLARRFERFVHASK